MTREQGRVAVTVPAPILGKVAGVKTLQEIMMGRAAAEKDEPAVITKPLPAQKPAAVKASVQ